MKSTKIIYRREISVLKNKKKKLDASKNNYQMLRVLREEIKIWQELNRTSLINLMDLLRFLCNTTVGLNQVCCSQSQVQNPIDWVSSPVLLLNSLLLSLIKGQQQGKVKRKQTLNVRKRIWKNIRKSITKNDTRRNYWIINQLHNSNNPNQICKDG